MFVGIGCDNARTGMGDRLHNDIVRGDARGATRREQTQSQGIGSLTGVLDYPALTGIFKNAGIGRELQRHHKLSNEPAVVTDIHERFRHSRKIPEPGISARQGSIKQGS
jgi:hypothetical protein